VSVPAWVYTDDRLTGIARAVYAALLSFADWQTGQCWPSHAALAQRSGFAVSSVQRALRLLQALGVVTLEHVSDARGQRSNRYTVRREQPEIAPDPSNSAVGQRDRGVRSERPRGVVRETDGTRTREQEPENENQPERPGEPGAPGGERRASERQRRFLRDLDVLGGDREPSAAVLAWIDGLTAAEADAEIREALGALPRGADYNGPRPGDPAYALLSDDGRRWADARGIPSAMEATV
jgi:hypothetical protein